MALLFPHQGLRHQAARPTSGTSDEDKNSPQPLQASLRTPWYYSIICDVESSVYLRLLPMKRMPVEAKDLWSLALDHLQER